MKLNFLPFIFLLLVTYVTRAQEQISLEQVIALALEKNYDVQLARKISDAAATDERYANAVFLPQLNAVGAIVWNSNEQELRFQDEARNNSGTAESNNTTASLQLSWTLFDGTRMFATRERVAQLAEQGELIVKDQMVNTIATIITSYYDIVRQKQQLKATQEQMLVSEERVKLAERKLQVGTGAKPELLQARVDYNAQRTQAIQQEALIIQLKEQLNSLVSLQLPPMYDVADTIIINLSLQESEVVSNIENTNFGLQASRRNLTISKLLLRERRAELLPFLNFNASYNYSRTENTQLINPFSPLFSQSDGYNYGFTVNIPILNNFNTRRLIQQTQIDFNRQELLYEQQKTVINVGIRNSYINYDNAKKILLIEEENILLAKENVFIVLESFKRGAATFIELRTAQQSLEDAYTSLITARYNAKVAETDLLRLSGALLR